MKNIFNKDNFYPSTMNKKQKIQSLIVSLLLIVFFIFSAFTFYNMLYSFADILGSVVSGSPDVAISDLMRSLPLYLSFFMSLWTVLLLQAFYKNVSDDRRHRSIMKNGITILVFSGVCIIYVLIMRLAGKYSSLVEGSPSALFPLDSILYSLLFVCIGVGSIVYAKRLETKLPYSGPSREILVAPKGVRILYCFGVTFWTLISLFGLFAGFLTMFIYDFDHSYVFYGISVILVYLLSPILLGMWEFYYHQLKPEKKRSQLLTLGIISTSVSVVCMVLYIVSLSTNMDAPANAGFGMFPITFTATANYGTMVVVACPLVVSIITLVRGIVAKSTSK